MTNPLAATPSGHGKSDAEWVVDKIREGEREER